MEKIRNLPAVFVLVSNSNKMNVINLDTCNVTPLTSCRSSRATRSCLLMEFKETLSLGCFFFFKSLFDFKCVDFPGFAVRNV